MGRRSHVREAIAVGIAMGAGALGAGVLSGCPGDADLCDPALFPYGVNDPDYAKVCVDPDAGADADASDAAADAPLSVVPPCTEQCVPLAPSAWDFPALVWIGPEQDAPPCPENASKLGYGAHADLQAPVKCGTCSCKPPTGTCELPQTITASSMLCPGTDPAAVHTPFDPLPGWDGACTTHDAVPAGQLCNGVPCVQSLTIAPLVLNETECVPSLHAPPESPPPTWSTFARLCIGQPFGSCGDNGLGCVPSVPPGFRVCVFQKGDMSCSEPELAPYTEKHVFYKSFVDTRSCAPCSCGSPSGGSCSASISIFTDGACTPAPAYMESISSSMPACLDLLPGTSLGSKSASSPTYTPGACAPGGGEPTGSADPADPATLCCIPAL